MDPEIGSHQFISLPGELRPPPPAKLFMVRSDPMVSAFHPIEKPAPFSEPEPALEQRGPSATCRFCLFLLLFLFGTSAFFLGRNSVIMELYPLWNRGQVPSGLGPVLIPEPSNPKNLDLLVVEGPSSIRVINEPQAAPPPSFPDLTLPPQSQSQLQQFIDPLENLLNAFLSRSIDHQVDTVCMVCFNNDSTRVRRALVGPDEESFLVYRSDSGVVGFSVITHTFGARPPSNTIFDADDQPDRDEEAEQADRFLNFVQPAQPQPFGPMRFPNLVQSPFNFFVADDVNAMDWAPVPVNYQPMTNAQGWETGMFNGNPPPSKFLKIALNDVGFQTWRPQIGQVALTHQVSLGPMPFPFGPLENPVPADEDQGNTVMLTAGEEEQEDVEAETVMLPIQEEQEPQQQEEEGELVVEEEQPEAPIVEAGSPHEQAPVVAIDLPALIQPVAEERPVQEM